MRSSPLPADGTRPRPAQSPARWFADYGEYFAVRAPSVVRLARLQLQDNAAAQDVAALVLEKVEKKWRHIRALSAPDAYVRKMLVNECISYQRKAARRPEDPVDPGSLPVVARPDESAAVAARDELRRALLDLPPQQRAVGPARRSPSTGPAAARRPRPRWSARNRCPRATGGSTPPSTGGRAWSRPGGPRT